MTCESAFTTRDIFQILIFEVNVLVDLQRALPRNRVLMECHPRRPGKLREMSTKRMRREESRHLQISGAHPSCTWAHLAPAPLGLPTGSEGLRSSRLCLDIELSPGITGETQRCREHESAGGIGRAPGGCLQEGMNPWPQVGYASW